MKTKTKPGFQIQENKIIWDTEYDEVIKEWFEQGEDLSFFINSKEGEIEYTENFLEVLKTF